MNDAEPEPGRGRGLRHPHPEGRQVESAALADGVVLSGTGDRPRP